MTAWDLKPCLNDVSTIDVTNSRWSLWFSHEHVSISNISIRILHSVHLLLGSIDQVQAVLMLQYKVAASVLNGTLYLLHSWNGQSMIKRARRRFCILNPPPVVLFLSWILEMFQGWTWQSQQTSTVHITPWLWISLLWYRTMQSVILWFKIIRNKIYKYAYMS